MVCVTSEVGRLRRVLLHEPGPEVDQMVPSMMEDLLFDDILFGDRAREEHRMFQRALKLLGIETLDAGDLLVETLEDPAAREWLLGMIGEEMHSSLRARIESAPPAEIVDMLVAGLRFDAAAGAIEADELFEIPPLPNWCFQRDPQIVLGRGVVFASMATSARYREALLARAIFRFHPELKATEVIHDPLQPGSEGHLFSGIHPPRIEGGDLLVLSNDVIAVGNSERTNRSGIQGLARALARREGGPRYLLIVELPRRRAYMHLDTLITPIDRDACLVFPPVICGGGPEAAKVHEIDLHGRDLAAVPCDDLLSTLRRRGIELEPIPCGGSDLVQQQREQWTDGSNAFALAPGIIVLYDRNVATADELARHGFRVIDVEGLLLGREEADLDDPGRLCILLASHEVARARGGPHCLSHPLERDEL